MEHKPEPHPAPMTPPRLAAPHQMTILRFPFATATKHEKAAWLRTFQMPAGAQIIAFDILPDGPSLWALCDESAPAENRYIATPTTGQELPSHFNPQTDKRVRHIATKQFQTASKPGAVNIIHVFEVPAAFAIILG